MSIIQDFIRAGRRNRPGRNNPMNFITIHETGNTNPSANALAHARYLHSDAAANAQKSWHYTTDDAVTVQHLPENEDAFHAGDGAGRGNRESIGIEMCVNSGGNFQRTIDRTAVLVADICARRNIPAENIRQHFDWSRKNCPENIRAGRPHSWEVFLNKVRAAMQEPEPQGVNLQIGSVTTKVPAQNIGGRWILSLPEGPDGQPQPDILLRTVLQTMGFSIRWDGNTNTIFATPSNS